MILFPPAKINLGLRVLRKRPDGYHEIDTCMTAVPWTDILEILPSENLSFHQSGLEIPGSSDDNLCVRAARAMMVQFDLPPVFIHLRKVLPMGAGLGGGSADAAFVLRGMRELFGVHCSDQELETIAATLGSDCPFFIKDETQIAQGRGEILSPCRLDLKGFYIHLINPGIHVGTAEAYAGIVLAGDVPSVKEVIEGDMSFWKSHLINDFEVSVFRKHQELAEIKELLYSRGAVYAAMSGSGSTMFGIFRNEPERLYSGSEGYIEFTGKF